MGATALGVVDLAQALKKSDFVVITLPLNSATREMFAPELMSHLKPGALIVNLARGAVVSRDAIARGLEQGKVGGYATDVWWDEPADPDDPLLKRDDVVLSPHIGGSTEEAISRAIDTIVSNQALFAAGKRPLHILNEATCQ